MYPVNTGFYNLAGDDVFHKASAGFMVGKPVAAIHKLFNAQAQGIAFPDTGERAHQTATPTGLTRGS
jgi:hypothetical protein